jgi:hypothetical protein
MFAVKSVYIEKFLDVRLQVIPLVGEKLVPSEFYNS